MSMTLYSGPVTTAHRPSAVLIPALFGSFLIILDASVVNVALPLLGSRLGADMSGLQWVLDGYTLMFAALLLSAGAGGRGLRRAVGGPGRNAARHEREPRDRCGADTGDRAAVAGTAAR
ncbi:hypothetical protein [Nocardia sp. NPDC051570]|uniref:hypothetical protein n=1 Tax=Nocardia sp. NPDC051570 TaxID=3364324 RepID=UPI003796699A